MATTVYRDYGALNNTSAPNNEFTLKRYTQVYQATHEGEKRLPFMNRSFISFSYGGKNIEDFSLIATNSGDRMEKDAYGAFEDLTTTYDVIHGQFYWGTYFHENTLTFNLSTDEMSQNELDDFKRWFRAGSIRELILAEHPNRGILARVSEPPQLNVLPFEKKVIVPISTGGEKDAQGNIIEQATIREYSTSTTVYRGDITLTLVMDDPFWYSIKNILGEQNTLQGYYENTWHDANGKLVSVKDSPDALKIIYEDHIPLGSTTAIDVFLGGDTYASVKYEIQSLIATSSNIKPAEWDDIEARKAYDHSDEVYSYSKETQTVEREEDGEIITENIDTYYVGAHVATLISGTPPNEVYAGARVGGASLANTDTIQGVDMRSDDTAHLYYAGTAPSPVQLKFTLTPQFHGADNTYSKKAFYIITPFNEHSDTLEPYNTITLESTEKHEFSFSLPIIWTSYNQVLQIFDDESIIRPGMAWLTIRETIRNTIKHPAIRGWANMLINYYDVPGSSGIITTNLLEPMRGNLKSGMQAMLVNNTNEPFPATFLFDGKTGLATGTFTYRNFKKYSIDSSSNVRLNAQIYNTDITSDDISSDEEDKFIITKTENVGDMVKSSYLILDERNVLDEYYRIQAWEVAHPDYAYKIIHNVPTTLHNIHFEFKNLYL